MQTILSYGAIVVECNSDELYEDPPHHTSLNPKSVYRTCLSWTMQFPLVHWFWCKDREFAEQTVYRLLEKWYQHETDTRYKHHNKPIDQNLNAYREGMTARMAVTETEVPYFQGNPLRLSWLRGWGFASTHLYEGDLGILHELGQMPDESGNSKPKKKPKVDESGYKPLPGQKELPIFDTMKNELGNLFDESLNKKLKVSK
jgi:hypothetical protein